MITLATAMTMHSAMVQTARSRKKSRFNHDVIGTIHILRQQRGRWVGSESVHTIYADLGGWVGPKRPKTC